MTGPELYIVAANEVERQDLTNDRAATLVIFGVVFAAFSLSAAVMLSIFWKLKLQRYAVLAVLGSMAVVGIFIFLRLLWRTRAIKPGEEFLLISGSVTAKRHEGDGDTMQTFISINGREFNVGPEVFREARIGARLGVREWYRTREFYDYTFSVNKLEDWLARGRRL